MELLHPAACIEARLLGQAHPRSGHAETEPEIKRLLSVVLRERGGQLREVSAFDWGAGPEKPDRPERCQPFGTSLFAEKVRYGFIFERQGLQFMAREEKVSHHLPLAAPIPGVQQMVRDVSRNPRVGERNVSSPFQAKEPPEKSLASRPVGPRVHWIPTRDGPPHRQSLLPAERSRPEIAGDEEQEFEERDRAVLRISASQAFVGGLCRRIVAVEKGGFELGDERRPSLEERELLTGFCR